MTVTYEQLFDILRREKSRDELQALDEGFWHDARMFLMGRQDACTAAAAQGMHSLASQRAQIEYQNVKKLLRELHARRERKILTLALHRTRTDDAVIDTTVLQPEERMLFDNMVTMLTQSKGTMLSFLDEPVVAREPAPLAEAPPVVEDVPVRFIAVVPKFVGKDLQVYGPFQEGQTTRLPPDVAQILIRKGRAQEDVSGTS